MSDPLGPLRSPLRPESSGPTHRREGALSRRRGRYGGERSDSQTDTGTLRNRRFNRDDSYKDLNYHPQDFAELNNPSDWPVVGSSSTNQNEGGYMIDRKGEGGGRRSVKDRLGPKPECRRQGRRELGQSDGQARLGQEGGRCDSRQGSRRRGRRNRSRRRGDGKRKRSEGEGEGGGEVEDGEIPCWAEVEGAGHNESWADQVEREEQQEIQREQQQQLRSRSFSLGSSTSSLSSRASVPGGRGGKRERERKEIPREKDESVLARRLKQIEYGINTPEYQEYRRLVPKTERTKFHPRTPDRTRVYSRRSFDTIVRIWRKSLHFWDPTKPKTNAAAATAGAGAGKIKNDDDACDMIASPRKKCKQEETETKNIGKSESAVRSESVVSVKQEVKQEPAGAVEEREIKVEPQHDESTLDGVKPFCTLDLGQDDDDYNIVDDNNDYHDHDGDDADIKDVKPVAFDLKLVKNEPENFAMECDDNEISIKVVKQEPARRSLRIEAKSPLKSRDVNVGGVTVKEEPDDDFDMYADL